MVPTFYQPIYTRKITCHELFSPRTICSNSFGTHYTSKLLLSTVGRAWQSTTASLNKVEHSLVIMIFVWGWIRLGLAIKTLIHWSIVWAILTGWHKITWILLPPTWWAGHRAWYHDGGFTICNKTESARCIMFLHIVQRTSLWLVLHSIQCTAVLYSTVVFRVLWLWGHAQVVSSSPCVWPLAPSSLSSID